MNCSASQRFRSDHDPTGGRIAGATLLGYLRIPVTAVAIVTVLSLTVPHAATTALQARLTKTHPRDVG